MDFRLIAKLIGRVELVGELFAVLRIALVLGVNVFRLRDPIEITT